MISFRGQYNEHKPVINKARMNIYDAVMMRQAESIQGVNMDYVSTISASLTSNNSWISTYKYVILEINDANSDDNDGIEFAHKHMVRLLETRHLLLEKKSLLSYLKMTPKTRAKRFVYTIPRSGPIDVCDRSGFVPRWTPMYESLQYHLLLFHIEPG